ncbi:hypothetical protein D3C71_1596850 [compost metagenome]
MKDHASARSMSSRNLFVSSMPFAPAKISICSDDRSCSVTILKGDLSGFAHSVVWPPSASSRPAVTSLATGNRLLQRSRSDFGRQAAARPVTSRCVRCFAFEIRAATFRMASSKSCAERSLDSSTESSSSQPDSGDASHFSNSARSPSTKAESKSWATCSRRMKKAALPCSRSWRVACWISSVLPEPPSDRMTTRSSSRSAGRCRVALPG